MKNKWLALSLALMASGAFPIVHAEGDGNSGKDKVHGCISCHGENGNSTVPTFPKLAQQHSSYLQAQLRDFKSGARKDGMMSALSAKLSNQDMIEIGDYFAAQSISANKEPVYAEKDKGDKKLSPEEQKAAVQKLIDQGSDLYRNGDLGREVSACIACHGPLGEGNKPAAFPALRGQHAEYLIKTLTDFKTNERANNPDNIMHMIARKMSAEEIKAVALRISTME